ncbi:hypothetical protein Snoj_33770 [Streptomyces nojiriensis]|uniref:CYTH domain-containing protein n=1 Tax=Streptomyces nojiriensis TaxID=66374 RepID=A0ABQ3SMV9_9ACTN|nr:hypothetical protein [Streptomyces nojiriensis]QTI43024.1 hypothetical protein JYK04_00786 [Streptomyces nojiriensis]GGS30446.1 hypothetical protein GCM10010205_70680 [Streptomyces nojiriensis]GHI69459.1 hypothetical protein Snoj_33770 [Streptomyces nojiriensis]
MAESPAAKAAEIKISFAGAEAKAAFDALELDRDEGSRRAIHFWDRPQWAADDTVTLPLLVKGVILRRRRDEEGPAAERETDLTVKLRPCPALPEPWRQDREGEDWKFKIEQDRTGPEFTPMVSASLEAQVGPPELLLIEQQRELLDVAGLTEADLADLTALGPVHAVKWKEEWDELPGKVAIEEWRTDNGLRFLEVSVRTDIADAAEVQTQLEQALRDRDVTPPPFGERKTEAVMTALARDAHL